jgi:LDH2 family malate/lactate/ureidoglycolate dehydrogenase
MPSIAERNLLGLLISSDPANSTVSPHGGISPVYSPNPVTACFPTEGDPVILDIMKMLNEWGDRFDVVPPAPLN